jgi:hypothetical protein
MTGGLQRRLLVMLISPLILLAFLNAWFDYRSADNVALQQDQRLVALVPLLADSVIGDEARPGGGLLMLMAPPIEEFLKVGPGFAAFSIVDPDGRTLSGEKWLSALPPTTFEPEFHSEENQGTTWRIVRQRVQSVAGEITVTLADGTDPRQQWSRAILFKVLLPNLVLITLAAFAVRWAVHRALKPLLDLKEAVERRSPRDLSAIDEQASPEEVRPAGAVAQPAVRPGQRAGRKPAPLCRRCRAPAAHATGGPAGAGGGLGPGRQCRAVAAVGHAARRAGQQAAQRHAAHLAAGQPAAGPVACRRPRHATAAHAARGAERAVRNHAARTTL